MKSIQDVIKNHGLLADRSHNKKMGQNFLWDTACLAPHIPDLSAVNVWEVGPGPGGLTRLLLSRHPKQFIATEYDAKCVEALQGVTLNHPNAEIQQGNALHVNPQSLFPNDENIVIAGNLPYNISTVLLTNWLHRLERVQAMYLMFQKEVVDRMAAKPGSKDYGRLSVIVQLCCEVRPLVVLPPEWFLPAPKVFSTFVWLHPKENAPTSNILKRVEELTHMAFSKRRKMIRQTIPPELLEKTPEVEPTLRPESIPPETFYTWAKMG